MLVRYIVSGNPESGSIRDLFSQVPSFAGAQDDDEVPDLVAGDVNFEQVATGDAK